MYTRTSPDPNAVESLYLEKSLGGGRHLYVSCCLSRIGDQTPHFSVMGLITNSRLPPKDRTESCGVIHEEILAEMPHLAPLVDLHLSKQDGVPMHAAQNGFYWAGGHREFNGTGPKDPPNADILAGYLRIPAEEAKRLVDEVTSGVMDKAGMAAFCETQKPRWADEAAAGLAQIRAGGMTPAQPASPAP